MVVRQQTKNTSNKIRNLKFNWERQLDRSHDGMIPQMIYTYAPRERGKKRLY
jgi:hypothetical protein